MIRTIVRVATLIIAAAFLLAGAGLAQTRALRFPDVHGDKVVFSYGGDLWVAPTSGGLARRLTAHPGVEYFAKFSPDGKWIAFTGQYDGDEQVYVIPAEGGTPKQLTFYPAQGPLPARWGYDHQVFGWARDGKSVLFRSLREGWSVAQGRLFSVSVTGGLPVALPMPESGAGSFSPDGKKVVYSPLFRDFRTWKRYEGGWAQDLYIFDLASHSLERITTHPRTDRDPMWIGDKVYFASDRDGKLNLYSYDIKSKQTRQITSSKKWDVRWPSTDYKNQIVFEIDGELYLLDVGAGKERKINITVPDDGLNRRPSRIAAANLIEGFDLSPKGQRAVIVARGDIFTVPIEKGPTRNLTNSSNAHDKLGRWSPDGRKLAFISDRSGEEEVWLVNQDGSGKPEQLTSGHAAMLYAPEWAPDGKRIAFSDKDGKLYVFSLADKKEVIVADETRGQLFDYTWSNDGGHLAFSLSNSGGTRSVHIWSVADAQLRRVTDPSFNAYNPAWDPDGNYLWYLSNREYQPQIGGVEFNFLLNRSVGIFGVALRKDVKNAFAPESDEVTIEEEKKSEPGKAKEPEKKDYLKIDFDGLGQRVTRVPIAADNYGGLATVKGHLLYTVSGAPFYGRESYAPPILKQYSLRERREATVAERVAGYATSADGTKTLVRVGSEFRFYELPVRPGAQPKLVSTREMMQDRVPAEEWTQIFDEVWRRFRDFFYVKNMHGYDWKALREQYRPQLKDVGHRADLNYILGEMVSELNVSHAYIAGGDYQIPPRPRVALLGARFVLDPAANRFKIASILSGQNEEERYRSPLSEIGVDVKVGDYILAIDGQELLGNDNPYRLLQHKGDRTVQLQVNSKPATDGARIVTVEPRTSETDLNYLAWITANRQRVEKLTDGKVGYIHIPDMGANGIREFIKQFYPQIRKEGLVVDVRGNGGGNVSQMLIERLRRQLLSTGFSRTNDEATTYPGTVFHGAMVCLLNENSASDGDIFPYMFRRAGLGPLIGKRSWGGVIGITNRGNLVDGGVVNVPEFGFATADGKWDIEGHGVDPDIVVENDPKSIIAGGDPQLERGVGEVLKRMKEIPKKLPSRPADPLKTK
jgi:tricorn protease